MEIRAEMTASVWKVAVREGQRVVDGDAMVVLESMKMEIPVLAEADWIVERIVVAEGDVVQEGDVLVEVS